MEKQWFVMRDLKRSNAKNPAYKQLSELGFTVFTPMTVRVTNKGSRRISIKVPYIQDLLFVQSSKRNLDQIVAQTNTLQYRFLKGQPFGTPMTVPTEEMERFIAAVSLDKDPIYYNIDEITPQMLGAHIRMISDGPFNTFEGRIIKIGRSRKKRILVELNGILAAAIELNSLHHIELLS